MIQSFIARVVLWGIILLFVGIPLSVKAESIQSSEYFPLESGMSWTYLEDGLNNITLSVLDGTEYVNGIATKIIEQSGGEDSGYRSYFTNDDNGIREHKEFISNIFIDGVGFVDITVLLSPPVKFANATASMGEFLSSTGSVNYTISTIGTFLFDYNVSSKVVDFENISVPAGNFDTIKIQSSLEISGYINGQYVYENSTNTMWLARYIGTVKSMTSMNGLSETSELVSINFQPYMAADFTAGPLSGLAPLSVTFTDQSAGNITSWSWDFGDGESGSTQNPTHLYTTPGSYPVTLTVSGLGAADTVTKTGYIRIAQPGADINKDNLVDLADLILVLQIAVGAEPAAVITEPADINGDMKTGLEEGIYILQFISGAGH